ncbi:gamma-glutamyl-gamma-aminobutyrate hydrolase family protein [Helicobacter muridarum]|uniref:Gamma-glutamyl-gamma-aminobutyrate hydrolase family protein n=1 Tax=Helicobacter muridarum TaxID=216 RepID=A0A099U2Y4_9HELI|nr:gamma-glutamyl-CDP-amidate hydrolase [Helicobacter muridarum]TLE00821.1 gamma-glutamyl-gamma-aminobutyrate hydrolase family protein [Helicobacter muridarum]STQ86530.1 putative glutamine amidotransferase class-I [Helicobacter muridarum]
MRIIAITQRLLAHTEYYEIRETLSTQWGELFQSGRTLNGFIPMPLSYTIGFHHYIDMLKNSLAGVILSGGNDLSCCLDSDIRNSQQGKLSIMRDDYEAELIEICMKSNIPLLGICRGAQMIAWHFGSEITKCNNHVGTHKIKYTKNISPMQKLAESNTKLKLHNTCNSFHNYCISKLSNSLLPLAICEDNSIEAFRHEKNAIYGIMWHIERKDGLENNIILQQWLNNIRDK